MQKDAAQKLIKETLQNSFDKERFVYFSKNLLNEIDEAKAFHARGYVKEKYKQQSEIIKTYERIGTFTTSEDKKIDVLIVYLQKEGTIDRARTTLRNFVADYLKDRDQKDAALVAFVSPNEDDWRFSLVKMEYKFNEKGKVEEEFTPARRYSFLVGSNENSHTAQSCLLPLLLNDEINPTLKELENVFSVEKVIKEFFEKYRELFLKLKESLDEIVKKDKKVGEDFKTKNVNTIDFAKKLLGQIVFLYFLQKKGWFGVERNKEWDSGSKCFLRELFEKKHGDYKNFFNEILEPLFYEALRLERTGDYYSHFDCRIPFLNGGLFDPLNDYDWVDTEIELPNEIFSNEIKDAKTGDVGIGILDVFDRYNFTVKEDEPLEKEVAVDPEMLGKVFENLLKVKDRKSKGTYYTPREIVHYMCRESLANYLATELEDKTSKEDIETLIKYGESVVEHDSRVINEGRETKAYSFKLSPSVRKHAKEIDDKLASIRVCDPAVGSGAFPVGMMNEVIRTRNALTPYIGKDKERTPYNFKRHAIQNCLYGVDIDPSAVEITKLRLWLSLVVDEEERKTIQPLPNLDYKIVQGNSLLSVEQNLFNQSLFAKLEELKPLYFNETSARKKQNYKEQIDKLISQITNGHKDFDFEIYFSEVFHEKKGFDVVIANPPYETSRSKGINVYTKRFLHEHYETAEDKYDYYTFFIEKASKLTKNLGYVCFITPSTYLLKPLSKKIRKYLLSNFSINRIIEFKGFVFTAVVPTAIILFQDKIPNNNHKIINNYNINSIKDFLDDNFSKNLIKQVLFNKEPDYYINIYTDEFFISFFENLINRTDIIRLGELAEIYNGIQTGNDEKFIGFEKKSEDWYKILTGSDIQKYYKRWGGKYVYYKPELLHSNTRKDIFKTKEKIIIRQTSDRIIGTYDEEEYFTLASTFIIKQFNKKIDYKSLLAILNSHLFLYFYRNINNEEGRVLPQIKKKHIFNLPIKLNFNQKSIVRLVAKILAITKSDDYLENRDKSAKVRVYEKQIDQLVYKLFDLTPEEISIIDNFDNKKNVQF